jgi:hypothetical protein
MRDCSLGCVEGFLRVGGFGGMELFALWSGPGLSYLFVSPSRTQWELS